MLNDIVIHSLDIRRPLDERWEVLESRLILVANDLLASRFFPGRKLFNGFRVEAIMRTGAWRRSRSCRSD